MLVERVTGNVRPYQCNLQTGAACPPASCTHVSQTDFTKSDFWLSHVRPFVLIERLGNYWMKRDMSPPTRYAREMRSMSRCSRDVKKWVIRKTVNVYTRFGRSIELH